MKYCYIDWDIVIKVVREAVIPIAGFIVALVALYYNRLRLKIHLYAVVEQAVDKNYKWSVRITISNSGFIPFSIVKIIDNNEKEVKHTSIDFPYKFDLGEIKEIIFPHEYSTRNSKVYVIDHRGKRHKVKIGKQLPLVIPSSFKEMWTEPNFRTFGHFIRYINLKFTKQ